MSTAKRTPSSVTPAVLSTCMLGVESALLLALQGALMTSLPLMKYPRWTALRMTLNQESELPNKNRLAIMNRKSRDVRCAGSISPLKVNAVTVVYPPICELISTYISVRYIPMKIAT